MNNCTFIKTEFFCRCCLSADLHFSDMISNTFEYGGGLINYFDAYLEIFKFNPSTIPDSFELKKQCEVCANHLKNVYTFHKNCQKSVEAFQQFIICSPNKIGKICSCCLYDSDALTELTDVATTLQKLFIDKFIKRNETVDNSKICNDCLTQLEKSRVFHELCTQTNNQLNKMFSGQNIPSKVKLEVRAEPVITLSTFTSIPVSFVIYDKTMVKEEPEIMIEDVLEPMLYKTGRSLELTTNEMSTKKNKSCKEQQIPKPDLIKGEIKTKKAKTCKVKRISKPEKKKKVVRLEQLNKYQCDLCPMTFQFRTHLFIHVEEHQTINEECSICHAVFTNPLDFKKHMSYHAMNTFVPVNSIPSIRPRNMQIYNRMQRGSYPCSKCTENFEFGLDFEIHNFQVHGDICPAHETLFPFLSDEEKTNELKHWVIFANSTHKYKCLKCSTKFTSTQKVRAHVQSVHVNLKKFKCLQCPAEYKSNSSLNYHLEHFTHETDNVDGQDPKNPFKCTDCHKKYAFQQSLTNHIKSKHMYNFKCIRCDKTCLNRQLLFEHSFKHTGGHPYNCNKCQFHATRQQTLNKHLKTEHNEKFDRLKHMCDQETFAKIIKSITERPGPDLETTKQTSQYQCEKCDEIFLNLITLESHRVEHEQKYQCAFCSAVYYNRRYIVQHMEKHMKTTTKKDVLHKSPLPATIKSVSCSLCPKVFKRKQSLRNHMIRKHGRETEGIQCLVCSQWYSSPANLKRHLQSVHSLERNYKCTECKACYKTKQDLQKHLKIHDTVDGLLKCLECPKTFFSKSGLVRHINVRHLKHRNKCDQCGKQYVNKEELRGHQFYHKGFDPYICVEPECLYTTKLKQLFGAHLLNKHKIAFDESIHSYDPSKDELLRQIYEERMRLVVKKLPYQCHNCLKYFPSKIKVQRHIFLKHLNPVWYECKFCDAKYCDENSLWRHAFKHKGIMPYQCNQCDYKIASIVVFQKHLRRKHKTSYTSAEHGYHKETLKEVMDYVLKKC